MTKADLVEQVAEAIGPGITKKDCAMVVDGFLNAVKKALATGDNIEIRGFGTFKVRRRKTRMARNPRTGDPVKVPMRAVPVYDGHALRYGNRIGGPAVVEQKNTTLFMSADFDAAVDSMGSFVVYRRERRDSLPASVLEVLR